MSKGKYDHLVKPLNCAVSGDDSRPSPFKNTGNADINRWLNGRDHLEGMNLNFSWGFYTGLGDWHPGMDPHIHPNAEALVFVGLDPDNIGYLGAEVQYCLGDELEVHTFDKPTVIIVPAGMPHCPSVTMEVTNPIGYGFFIIALNDNPQTTWMGDGISPERQAMMGGDAQEEGARKQPMESHFSEQKIHVSEETMTFGNKYDHLFKTLTPGRTPFDDLAEATGAKIGPGSPEEVIWLTGKDMEGLNLNFTWGFHKKPGIWHRGPGKTDGTHLHAHDEAIAIVGTDPRDINYLGAELSIDMGDERERHIVDQPSVLLAPAGTPHNPIITRNIERPFATFMMYLSDEYKTEYID